MNVHLTVIVSLRVPPSLAYSLSNLGALAYSLSNLGVILLLFYLDPCLSSSLSIYPPPA